ncbi:MAG: Xaa-Pro peptidase family protein [Gemmataceae bacterium]
MDHHAQRQERLARQLHTLDLDALLISSPHNVTYLTGFSGDSTYFVFAPPRAILLSDPRYLGQLADECPTVETSIRTPTTPLNQAAGQLLTSLGFRRVGIEAAGLTLEAAEALRAAGPTITWVPGPSPVDNLRMVKDAVEIEAIREAISIAERAFLALRSLMRPDDTEKDLADALEAHVRRCGGLTCAFPPICAVGTRAALPHCPPTSRRVHESGLLLVDWGATGPTGYRSDLTRVLPTHTKHTSADPHLPHIHAIVQRAQRAAFQAIRPGVLAREVDAAARSVIAEAGYAECFQHGLGHGIGLQIHEAPFFRATSEVCLEPGMIVTLEPGIYLPDWGGVRIEDDVLVTPSGAEQLTTLPQDLASMTVFARA